MRSPMNWLVVPTLVLLAGCSFETGTADEPTSTSGQQGLTDATNSTKNPNGDPDTITPDQQWPTGGIDPGIRAAPGDPVPWNPPKKDDKKD